MEKKRFWSPSEPDLPLKKKKKKRCSSVTPLLQITIASPFGQDWKRCRIILGMEESSEYPKYPAATCIGATQHPHGAP